MDDNKKTLKLKKLPKDVEDAEYRLNHAVVRGEPDEVLKTLRAQLSRIRVRYGLTKNSF